MSITWEQAEAIQKTVVEKGALIIFDERTEGTRIVVDVTEYALSIDVWLYSGFSSKVEYQLLALQWGASKVKSMWLDRSGEAPVHTYIMDKLDIGEIEANVLIGSLQKAGVFK